MYDTLPEDIRDGHPYHMYDEIQEQPEAVARSISLMQSRGADAARMVSDARRLFLTGCGTSLHAAMAGAWMFRALSDDRIDARAVSAYDLAVYGGPAEGDVVIGVTHSGGTAMTLRALETASTRGAHAIALTGFPENAALAAVATVLPTGYDEERSWAHTASYTAALASMAALANQLAPERLALDLGPLSETVRDALQLEEMARRLAGSLLVTERLQEQVKIIVVGGGPSEATAQEAVLKLLETAFVQAEAFHLEEMLHGPLAAVDASTALIVLAPEGRTADRAGDLARAALALGVTPVVLCTDLNADTFDGCHRLLMPAMPESLSPIPYVVPLQLFSYFLAIGEGNNPDLIHRDDERQREARAQYR